MDQTQSFSPLPADRLSVFCSQLSLMQQAGIPPEDGLSLLLEDAPAQDRPMLQCIHSALSRGEPLDKALKATGAFPPYLLQMVSIGLSVGRLDQVLSALSVYYQREHSLQGSIRRALVYPAMMAVLVALVFLLLMARVLPVFQQVFAQVGLSLSPAGQLLLRLSSGVQMVAAVVSVLLIAAALFLLYLFQTRRGSALAQRLGFSLLRRTAAGRLVDRSRFSSAMSLMLTSGLSLDEALERTCALLGPSPLAPKLKTCQDHMSQGSSFPRAVADAGILDGLQSGLLAAGFRAGAMEQTMEELAVRCQEEADERLGRLLGRFEYALVLVLCLAVGLVLLSVMLPLLGVMSTIGG